MKYLTSAELRNLWKQFWRAREHFELPSQNLLNPDSSLLWINSGVAGIKDYFLGRKRPPAPRLFNIQKAVRTNDLDNIGHTNRHLSFFEMMGNFALNDYHKKTALIWAWEFLTASPYLGLDKKKLYVTYYEKDNESHQILQQILKIPASHLVAMPRSTNFWDLGVGPCGPNLEFFYDLGSRFDPQQEGTKLLWKDERNERYLEIWNIVFSEFLNSGDKNYEKLPHKNIDTGAGLERLITVLQKKNNCFETDIFQNSRAQLEKLTGKRYWFRLNHELSFSQQKQNYQFKVILDHMRTVVFLITDLLIAQQPIDFQSRHSYIIRKLLRTAILQFSFLYRPVAFLQDFLFAVIADMNAFYPELETHFAQTQSILLQEEKKFLKLLQDKTIQNFIKGSFTQLSGKQIFTLVSSVGMPLEFVKKIAAERSIALDLKTFQILWKEHQKISKFTAHKFVDDWKILSLSNSGSTVFRDNVSALSVKILAIFVKGKSVDEVTAETCWIICDQTPFYAEKGGQIYDIGVLQLNKVTQGQIINVQTNYKNQVLHQVQLSGSIKINMTVELEIAEMRRQLIRNNHSATHLLHGTLRNLISPQIRQTGSFNNDQYLRLDFTFERKITFAELIAVERQVNHLIKLEITPQIVWTSLSEAKKQKALAFFEEFYDPAKVRLVQFKNYSAELCGGTHVANTKSIEQFFITRLENVSQNNYRIYALTTKQKCQEALSTLQREFQIWMKKNRILQSPSFVTTEMKTFFQSSLKTLSSSFYSLLIWQEKTTSWKTAYKKYVLINQNKILTRVLEDYSIPADNYVNLSNKTLLFHLIKDSHNLKEILLWKLFDKFQKEKIDLLCLFLSQENSNYRFVLLDRDSDSKCNWKILLTKKFSHNAQIGGNSRKMQGQLQIPDLISFQKWLISCFFNSEK